MERDMSKNIGILHLSDIHACAKNKQTLDRLVEKLKSDLDILQSENATEIKFICITGDLIHSGDKDDEEMDIVIDSVISPLMEYLKLSAENVFIVPGNHEVKRSLIIDYVEKGLSSLLVSEIEIDKHLKSNDAGARNRISYFDSYASLFSGEPVLNDGLCRAYIKKVGDFELGIACINSAWRSTGIGGAEKGKMVIGTKQIVDSFQAIKDTSLKICLLHHPLDWLIDCDKVAVEKCIHQFDIVLNGHIHESDSKVYTTFNGHSLFNTSGKLDNSSDIYNGYSVLSINPFNKECNVFLRQYLVPPRDCYDKAIHLCPDGQFVANLGNKDDSLGLAYNIVHSIQKDFIEYANGYFVSSLASGRIVSDFDDAFIPPLFSEYSDYEKETVFDRTKEGTKSKKEEIDLESICNGKDNLVLLGRKESGKTTTIHYLVKYLITNFNAIKSVPIVIDCQYADFAGKNVISRIATRFINDYCLPNDSYSQSDIEVLMKKGLCTIMFDGFEAVKPKVLEKVNKFIQEYPQNRYIFCEKEILTATAISEIPIKPDCDYKKYHLCPLTKKQIRAITQKTITTERSEDKSAIVDRIMLCFKNTSLPRTPFILSIILSLCDGADYSPINEAVVLEQFMELLLGKHSPQEASTNRYDFRAKEDFLISLVSEMLHQNRFYLSYCEFSRFLGEYHSQKGFDIVETQFDKVFFQSGILVRANEIVKFRYNCMIEYYTAKRAAEEPQFLNDLLTNQKYIHFPNEILYYTGLNRRSLDVLKAVQTDLRRYYTQIGSVTEELNNYQIEVDISLPEEVFSQKLEQGRLTQEESDELSDVRSSADPENAEIIDKSKEINEGSAFAQTLQIFGNCIKNLEFIDIEEKHEAFCDYLRGLSIILALMKQGAEMNCEQEIKEMLEAPEEYSDKDIEELKRITNDFIKIALPICIQNIALDNIGTIKLKSTYEAVMRSNEATPFYRFFSTFILCDLRVPGVGDIIKNYLAGITDKSLLKIAFFKLMYYYQLRYFDGEFDHILESELSNINLKLNGQPKFAKSEVIKQLRASRIPQEKIK